MKYIANFAAGTGHIGKKAPKTVFLDVWKASVAARPALAIGRAAEWAKSAPWRRWLRGIGGPIVCGLAAVAISAPLHSQTLAAQPNTGERLAPREAAFPSRDGTQLKAWVFETSASGSGTVVALHGCGGLYGNRATRAAGGVPQLNARHQAMAEMLVGQGYRVVFPDSLTPRGETELCTQKMGSRRIDQTQRRADALGALEWIAAQTWGNPARVALLGWSHGGSAVLAASNAAHPSVTAGPLRFATAIAFYPGCSASLKTNFTLASPLALMLGALDDWTPSAPCEALAQRLNAPGGAHPVEVNLYAQAFHDFDNPVGQVRLRADVPNGVNPGQGVHAGANPAARALAYARVTEILAAALAPVAQRPASVAGPR